MARNTLTLMEREPMAANSTVSPSGAARCTSAMPMLPLAPGRLSTSTGAPSNSDRRGAMMRA
jgi:hypothetical protein